VTEANCFNEVSEVSGKRPERFQGRPSEKRAREEEGRVVGGEGVVAL
jgi:hypothetical protein